jgi:predicted dehydrogenase
MKKIKIGVFGAGRGVDLAKNYVTLGCEIVALCDFRETRVEEGIKKLGFSVPTFTDFDEFLKMEMDAVIIANYFHEHAPYTIKCFEKGIHVFCECISNGTMAEGVKLFEAFKNTKSIYMLAENYPQMLFNREIKRICDNGSLGKIMYAEGEYNHPGDPFDTGFMHEYNYFADHWRNYLPTTYYITHSLGPIMWQTGATPKKVTAFSIFAPYIGDFPSAKQNGDRTSIITTYNDDGSVFRVTGCAAFGGHHNSYRVCGTDGQIENLRGMDDKVMLHYNSWNKPADMDEYNLYKPSWNDKDEEMILKSGHGGADYLTCRMFLECVLNNTQPPHPFNLESAINMSSVAILAHRSALLGGEVFDIPNFNNIKDCKLYENDYLSPFLGSDGSKPTITCCSNSEYKLDLKQLEYYNKLLNNK